MRFERKPKPDDVIEGFQWTGGPDQVEDPEWFVELLKNGHAWISNYPLTMNVLTVSGVVTIKPGGYIFRNKKGEVFPRPKGEFERDYRAEKVKPVISDEQDYFDTLKRITQYDTPERLKKNSERDWGLDYKDALEMAYENILEEAKGVIKGKSRPK